MQNYLWFNQVDLNDIARVGGKNASLGEMISKLSKVGVSVPFGFATSTEAFHNYMKHNNL